jgi:hypothetical protein
MRPELKKMTNGVALPEFNVLAHGRLLDQLLTGTCVGHTWLAWENCYPRGRRHQQGSNKALEWYDRATILDPWPDNDGDRQAGTSTQAGAQVALEWGLGKSYIWATTLEDARAAIVSEVSPVVFGTYWYWSMDETDSNGVITVDLRSGIAGGHEWLCFGVTMVGGVVYYVCQNSWGEGWGADGIFYVSENDMRKLLYSGGEACIVVQTDVLPRYNIAA